ncbi:MAG: sulfatase-like hydrolase/transferase [Verrucomicrobia bacterium]|nr:sulfatase-like hydrolase/transferase [Verrucomicrobiota bacterium]
MNLPPSQSIHPQLSFSLRKIAQSCLLVATLFPHSTLQAATPAKPNIVFILADDLGFAELSCNGGEAYKTPHIDALAKGGVRFSNTTLLQSPQPPTHFPFHSLR